jgi:hypothetical protein
MQKAPATWDDGVQLVNRRSFCAGLLAAPSLASSALSQTPTPKAWDHYRRIRFILSDPLDHPFFWWPRTLLSYPIVFEQPIDLNRLILTRTGIAEQLPIQLSDIVKEQGVIRSATLHFFSDLPSGAHYEFLLTAAEAPTLSAAQVHETTEGDTIVLDTGAVRVRIPTTQTVRGEAPGPILQLSRGGVWVGSSTLAIDHDTITQITTTRIESGPIFITYEVAYDTAAGSRYVATIQANAGMNFIHFREDMEGIKPGARGAFTSTWTGFDPTHRQAPNHPLPISPHIRDYDKYPWETIDEPFPLHTPALPEGELPFALGIYQSWTAFHNCTSANFWNQISNDALGVFIDRTEHWQDHEYANHVESDLLLVRYFHHDGKFSWHWPIAPGTRSSCVTFYDHEKDKQATHRMEQASTPVEKDGISYRCMVSFTSYAMFLQNRHGALDLNRVKDWVLEYPDTARQAPVIFATGTATDANDIARRVLSSSFVCSLPISGTRENGSSTTPGRDTSNFSPVPSRQITGWWIDGFNRFRATMTAQQRRQLTAMYLLMAYVCAGDDFFPIVPMLSGHPNFLADVKGAPPCMSFLFPDHPMAPLWADYWQKCVELNTHYNTRPTVDVWNATGGRWTENLGTYVWAFLRPSLRTDFLLRNYDNRERFATPELAQMADWLVNVLSAPFAGETREALDELEVLDRGHSWGVVHPEMGLHRVHPPQGAHSERRIPPRSLWYLGTCLQRFAPLAAEHAMWAARPTNQDMETQAGAPSPWDNMYATPDNLGTDPHLRSMKHTGYGVTMRAAVGTAEEVSIHLQQIDEGPNYRWGLTAEGGCGVIYFFAAGKSYSFNGTEDVGDRGVQDTDVSTNFGVYKDGMFRSIGMNVISRPFYNLGAGQFAELVPRESPAPYSFPEYRSRSILLAGADYFILYDEVLTPQVDHRLSWFVRNGSELPTIKLLRGWTGVRESQRTEVKTSETTGVWIDGVGDSMALISHRKDLDATPTAFGCRVRGPGIDDLVFRNPTPIHFSEAGCTFSGTSGLIRTRKDKIEFALFHGTKISAGGITFTTADTDLGIGGAIAAGQLCSGEFFALHPTSLTITADSLSEKTTFYIDAASTTAGREANALTIQLPAGQHSWELTDTLPVPIAPHVLQTENHSGGARVFVTPVAAASQYRVELSKDAGATWSLLATQSTPTSDVTGLPNGQKVHIRAVAINSLHESAPGDEYPLYITNQPPPPPDGLRVALFDGSATLTWGQILGVTEYRLYTRAPGERTFRTLYRGLDRTYVDKHASIRPPVQIPGEPAGTVDHDLIEYYVTAVNANGESPRSAAADTNNASWINWNPRPGEPFRREWNFPSDQPPSPDEWPRYYPS